MIRIPGQPPKSDVPGVPGGRGMGSEQFDRRIMKMFIFMNHYTLGNKDISKLMNNCYGHLIVYFDM